MTEKGLLLQHAIPCFPDLHSKIKTQKWGWGGRAKYCYTGFRVEKRGYENITHFQ